MSNPNNRSAAYRLFHHRYAMMIPQLFFYSRHYIDKHGFPSSGNPQLDKERMSVPSMVMQTPAALAMFHAEGCPIQIVNETDSVKIYNDIREHLLDWERAIKQGIHLSDVPAIEEFRMLEAIAIAIYRLAKHFQPANHNNDDIRDRLMAMNMRRNPVQTDRLLRNRITDDKGELKPYISIVDRIEKEIFAGYQ